MKMSKSEIRELKKAYADYVKKFRKQSTATLVRRYKNYNSDFRNLARDELRKRKVPAKQLPFRRRTRKRHSGLFDLNFKL